MDVRGNVACPRTGPPHRRGVFKGLVWHPMGAANTAHLLLQFYFHIISISKTCLAALAVALDKRERELKGIEGRRKKEEEKEVEMCVNIQGYSELQIHVHLLKCLSLVCVGQRWET